MAHNLGMQDFEEVILATAFLLDPVPQFKMTDILDLDDHWTAWVRFGPKDQAVPHLLCECDFGYGENADEPYECSGKALARLYRRLELREKWSWRYRDNSSEAILDLCARARHMFIGQRHDERLGADDLADIFVVSTLDVARNIGRLRHNNLLSEDWSSLQALTKVPSS